MNNEEIREKLAKVAAKHDYKRLARAVEEDSFSAVVSELMKYKNRKEIITEIFEDSFIGKHFAQYMLKHDPESLEEILKTAGELTSSTEDEAICSDLAYFIKSYRELFPNFMAYARDIAYHTKDAETVKEMIRFMTDCLFTFDTKMRDLCSFNFRDPEKNTIAVGGRFDDKYFESSEELAKAVKFNLDTYKIALADFKGRAYTPAYEKGGHIGALGRMVDKLRGK